MATHVPHGLPSRKSPEFAREQPAKWLVCFGIDSRLMRLFGLTVVAAIILGSPSLNARGAEPAEALAWDSVLKEFSVNQGEMQVATFFAVTNVSQSDVVITQVVTSCGCTVASLPSQPWRLAPGSDGKINATLNLAGRFGTVIKTLTVISSVGNKVLTIKANVPPPPPPDPEMAARIRNQEAAKADRLAVFRNNCAQCQQQIKSRHQHEHFTNTHEDAVHLTSVIPGRAADQQSDRERN